MGERCKKDQRIIAKKVSVAWADFYDRPVLNQSPLLMTKKMPSACREQLVNTDEWELIRM